MQAERGIPPQSECEADLKRKLSRALLHFQDRLLEANISPGSLCQVRLAECGWCSVSQQAGYLKVVLSKMA